MITGEAGIVVSQHKGLPQRPVIRVFKAYSNQGRDYVITDLDLAERTTVFIETGVE
ncbi:hypothetical protein [Alteribacillus bidgolensis]|uniref:Uncharacterized protein n=1 Tax=Alteribacillus bidgolensis TaxID=930129 RepID=A0A1G8G0N3_9BACI|nr:hypothetical protein [Alteribacillus bidgolensis]SDH87786.1 hypothetical protein SAMN05216352_103165 [Alteribacillus bidgolensis]